MQQNVPAFVMVTVDGFRADSSNLAHRGKVVGMTTVAVNSGFIASLVDDDEVTNPAWAWTSGQKLFLNGTGISPTAPSTGFSQLVAVARNPVIAVIQLGPAIML